MVPSGLTLPEPEPDPPDEPPHAARAAAKPAAIPMVDVRRMKSRREARGVEIAIDVLLKSDVCCLTLVG